MPRFLYPKYSISKRELYDVGEILRNENSPSERVVEATDLLGKWRAMHAYPINTFQANIRAQLKKNSINAIVAQRLKRMPSILHKLSRFQNMRLDRMQDIGGLRIIVTSINDVYKVKKILDIARWKHKKHHEKDYIASPADSGYRSVHLIYKYHNIQAPEEYEGLQIEIQIRTKIQHAWATAVETIGTFINHSLKSSQGPGEWLDFLKLASAVLAVEEKTNIPVCYKNVSQIQLVKQLYEKAKQLRAFELLTSFHTALSVSTQKEFKKKYILLIIDPEKKEMKAVLFNLNQLTQATNEYLKSEQNKTRSQDIVLVSTQSLAELRKAYPNYFIDASEFIKLLRRTFKQHGLPLET